MEKMEFKGLSTETVELLDLVKSYSYLKSVSVEVCLQEALRDWLDTTATARMSSIPLFICLEGTA